MDLELVVRAGDRTVPVTVHAGPRATLGDLRRAAAELLDLPTVPASPFDARPLTGCGLVRGGTLRLDAPGTEPPHHDGPDPDRGPGAPVGHGAESGGAAPADRRVAGRPRCRLAVAGGRFAGAARTLLPGATVTVGREPGRGGLRVPDPEVSRVHARCTVTADGAVQVIDAGSTNGVRHGVWRVDRTPPLGSG